MKWQTILVMAKEYLNKRTQHLLFPLLRNQGKQIIFKDYITLHIYYSNHGASDVEHFEMANNYSYGKGIPVQKNPTPPVPPPKKPR